MNTLRLTIARGIVAGVVSMAMVASMVLLNPSVAGALTMKPIATTTTLAQAPANLKASVMKNGAITDAKPPRLSAHYTTSGALLSGAGPMVTVGRASIGREHTSRIIVAGLARHTLGATYVAPGVAESFKPVRSGIEQTFTISQRPLGKGDVIINVPVSGVLAKTAGTSIDLRSSATVTQYDYSGLRVTDANGKTVPAVMLATHNGHVITIKIDDARATYPLTVDPTWTQIVAINEGNAGFGQGVAIYGDTAVIGAPADDGGQGAAYVYTLSGGAWSETAELTAPDGVSGSNFGGAVAIDSSAILVAAWQQPIAGNSMEGAVYVYTGSGSSWSLNSELDSTVGMSDEYFGVSIAIDGTTIVVGSYTSTNTLRYAGEVYVFTPSDGVWTQAAELLPSNPQYDALFGQSVGISDGTIVVGASQQTVGSNQYQGEAYIFTGSGSSWSQQQQLFATGGAADDDFGDSAAITGTTLVLGAPFRTVGSNSEQGAAYVFTESGSTWTQQAELSASDGVAESEFAISLAISGSNIAAGEVAQDNEAYIFTGSGSSWTQKPAVTATDPGYTIGALSSVGISGSLTIVGASEMATYHYPNAGGVFIFTDSPLAPVQGTIPGPDLIGGGATDADPSAACPCAAVGTTRNSAFQDAGNAAEAKEGEPVDTATGDFSSSATDLDLPGAGVPLKFDRTYDAQAAQAEVTNSVAAGPLGYGWSDNFGANVSYNSTTQVATVTEGNGAQVGFSLYSSTVTPPGAWCTDVTNFCALAPRFEATLNQNGGGTWTYTTYNGPPMTYSFNSSGALTSIADALGDTVSSSTYSPSGGQTTCPSGDTCVAWTSSASGRELVLATTSSGQLAKVLDANSSLAASFAYSGSGCSSWSGSETPDLCTVTDPGGIVSTYTYDSANSTAAFDYDMLTFTPAGATSQETNVYSSSGQITQQTDPDGDVTTFAYAGTNSSYLGGTTTITAYPDGTGSGEPQDATLDAYSDNVLVTQTLGYGTANAVTTTYTRDPNSLLHLTVTDGDGNITTYTYQTYSGTGGTQISSSNVTTVTDGAGNTSAFSYNADDQVWCTVDPADYLNGARCPSSPPSSPPAPGTTDPDLGMVIDYYNSSDQLIATTDALGNTTTYAYTSGVSGVPNGLLYCSVDPVDYQGSVSCPTYGAGHVTGTTTSTFDAAGDVTSTTNADGDTTTYAYADGSTQPGLVSSETDPDGTVTTFNYNGAGEVTSQVVTFNSYSATTLYAYDASGRLYCEVDPYEAALSVTCPSSAPSSPPTPSSDPYLGATITTYDADGRVVQVTNALGGVTYDAYDGAGELFCTVAPLEAAASITCPSTAPSSPPTVGSDSYLGATMTTFDANGQVIQVTNPLGGITLYDYDGAGNVSSTTTESNSSTLAPNVTVSYEYNSDNQVDEATNASGATLTSYDPDGNVFCTVAANAYASSSYQCPTWQASWIAAPPSPSALYSTSPTSAQANNVTTDFYDANGDLLQSTNPDVQTSISVYDAGGQAYCSSDPVNVATYLAAHGSATYPYNCPASAPSTPPSTGSDPGYVTTIYDAAGETLSNTNQLGDTTAYTYDAAGHVLTTTDPRGEVTTNCYYDEDGTGACAHGAPSTGGSGDDLYSTTRPDTSADPSGEVTTDTYYPGDLVDVTTTLAATATDNYDALGDLLSANYSGIASGYITPTNLSYTYNVDGSPLTMTDASGTTTYGYDAMGDVTSQALVAASGSNLTNTTTSYAYFTTGALETLTYPAYTGESDPAVSYAYNDAGQLISSTDWLGNEITYAYDADGNQTSQDNDVSTSYPSGTSSTAFTYDAADNNTAATSTINQTCGSSENLTQSFSGASGSRNADGQLTEYTDAYSATCSGQTSYERNYSYDVAGDVVYQGSTAQGSNPNNSAYDASGDPTTISSHSGASFDTYTQTYDAAGEVTGQSPVSGSGGATSTYTYDTLGDQIKDVSTATNTYGFNAAGQMSSVTTPSNTTTYLYNGDGLAVSAQSPGTATSQWNSPQDVDATRALDVISCLSSTFCVAVGASGYASTYNGTGWSTPTDVDSTRTMDALDCVSATFCVAVDTSGYAVIYNGTSWGTPSDIDSSRSVDAVSCTSSSFCVAVGASGYAAIYTGSWASSSDVDSSRTMDAVSCVSTSFCVTGDTSGYSAKYTGSWASATDIDSSRSISTIACTSSTFCVTGDTSGYSAKYTGSWASATDIDGSRSIRDVVCVSSSFCLAVDGSGYSAKYTGSWASATDIDGSTALESLTCVSTSYCVTSDGAGNVLTYNGTWGSATSVDATRSVSSISCPTTSFCAAVDASGYAVTYAPVVIPPIVSQLTWDTNGSLALVLGDSGYYYVYGPGSSPVEQISLATSSPTYLTYSPSNSTWMTTNESGDETGFYGYDAYGSLAFGTPTSAFGFAGQYTDAASGFSNLRNRYYDPSTGQFASVDPMVNETGQPYLYAGDDPVNGVDPNGLCFLGGSWCNGIQNAVASTFDSFRHQTAALVDLPPDLVLATGASIYNAYDNIYQDGANGCSFFSSTTLSAITWALTEDVNAGLMAGGDEEVAAEEGVADVSAATPVGRSGTTELNVTSLNTADQVDGISYSGHAFDQMQARGIVPSAVKDAITYGAESSGADGTTVYYSSVNNLSVVLNEDGTVVTSSWGHFKPR